MNVVPLFFPESTHEVELEQCSDGLALSDRLSILTANIKLDPDNAELRRECNQALQAYFYHRNGDGRTVEPCNTCRVRTYTQATEYPQEKAG